MLNWTKDDWKDIKLLLDELEYDYECDFEGNLILHFEKFEILNEVTQEVVDTVDHMWLKFIFTNKGNDFYIKFYRQDVYRSNEEYTHPHVQAGSNSHCTGSYTKGISLLQDILYYTDYIRRYNPGQHWTLVPNSSSLDIDASTLNKYLIPTFHMDITKGYPVVSNVSCSVDINQFITERPLSDPKYFFWKGNSFKQYSKGSRVEHLDLTQYFNYAKFIKRYSDATSVVPDANPV